MSKEEVCEKIALYLFLISNPGAEWHLVAPNTTQARVRERCRQKARSLYDAIKVWEAAA